jgi:signal transduction histidine kinase/HAMP domain-containing protein
MFRFSSFRTSLRTKLVLVILVATAPALAAMCKSDNAESDFWLAVLAGLLAIGAAWFSWGGLFLHQINALLNTTRKLAAGDFNVRTGLQNEPGELGGLARSVDSLADSLQKQVREREQAERTLLNRTHQQTVVAAVGQFALASNDFYELLDQCVNFIAQTLELEYCGIWEMEPDGQALLLRTGTGWKQGRVGTAELEAANGSFVSHVFTTGGAITITDLPKDGRFDKPTLLSEHGVVSGCAVTIAGGTWPYGILGVFTAVERKFSEDELHFLLAIATVIAMAVNRRQTEVELQKAASFAQFNPNPVMEFNSAGHLTYFNDAAMAMANNLGLDQPSAMLPPETGAIIRECLATGVGRLRHETRQSARLLSWSFFPIASIRAVHCYVADITDRANLENQLRQSQKMESIGQLAAGVAHDFNNMLTIIQGHSGVIMARQDISAELLDSAQAIYFASERAANLTRQLLMFSRKNILQPRPLDLREVVGNMTKMLQRMIGEIITLRFIPPAELPFIRGDAGMIEQIIMNLGVNARDAMLKGGTLTLTLQEVSLDHNYNELHPQARPGRFIRLDVADTGTGMSPEIQARIFEPFFTTKEVGKGTGLGLATVYGIVKQHDGWIEVNSELGKGTTFQVFFPASLEPVGAKPEASIAAAAAQVRGGQETILLVEDEPVLRDLAHLILTEHGYRVLQADNGVEALNVWKRERENIDLLLTDFVMPEGMSGKELADQLRAEKPVLKVICVSGYNVEDMSQSGMVLVQKPYTRFTLAKTVRDCLDAKAN